MNPGKMEDDNINVRRACPLACNKGKIRWQRAIGLRERTSLKMKSAVATRSNELRASNPPWQEEDKSLSSAARAPASSAVCHWVR